MKNTTLRDLLFVACCAVWLAIFYFAFPNDELFWRIIGGAVMGFVTFTYVFEWLQKNKDGFAVDMNEAEADAHMRAALREMKSDGSFFATPKSFWGRYPRLQISFLILLGVLGALFIASATDLGIDLMEWVIIGLGTLALIYSIVKAVTAKTPPHERVVFFRDHLVFLPADKKVPYKEVEWIDYKSFRVRGGSFTFSRLIIRHNDVSYRFEWNQFFPSNVLELSIFHYFGFEETVMLGRNMVNAGFGYHQRYVFDPSLAPKGKIDPSIVAAAKRDNFIMIALFVIAILAFIAYDMWVGF